MKNLKIKDIGERGFLSKLLPRLSTLTPSRFLVPPGDDAAILKGKEKMVLSMDGLTEGTHFKLSWEKMCRSRGGFTLGRGLGWKLMGSSLSDLAAMGHVQDPWALVYLGSPAHFPVSFLLDIFRGVKESASRHQCALVGGDTVRSKDLTLVAAVGGTLKGRPLERSGARVGDALCVAGTVGDAFEGLQILLQKKKPEHAGEGRFFVERFFKHEPMFKIGRLLAQTEGVTSLIDLSDSLEESIHLLLKASHCGGEISLDAVPVSSQLLRNFGKRKFLLKGGEDYSLLFTAHPRALPALHKKIKFSVVGRVLPASKGIKIIYDGKPLKSSSFFQHFH